LERGSDSFARGGISGQVNFTRDPDSALNEERRKVRIDGSIQGLPAGKSLHFKLGGSGTTLEPQGGAFYLAFDVDDLRNAAGYQEVPAPMHIGYINGYDTIAIAIVYIPPNLQRDYARAF
jgi:hypothetical protein